MAKFLWKKIYKVGISDFDGQHKKLIDCLNKLSHLLHYEKNDITIRESFDELINYTNYHFEAEEKHFAQYKYPFVSNNLEEHSQLKNKLIEMKNRFKFDKKAMINDLHNFSKDLLVKHMMLSGKRYGMYLSKGISY